MCRTTGCGAAFAEQLDVAMLCMLLPLVGSMHHTVYAGYERSPLQTVHTVQAYAAWSLSIHCMQPVQMFVLVKLVPVHR